MHYIFVKLWHLICAMHSGQCLHFFFVLDKLLAMNSIEDVLPACCNVSKVSAAFVFAQGRVTFLTDCAEHSKRLEHTAKRWSGSHSDWEELTLILVFNFPRQFPLLTSTVEGFEGLLLWRRRRRRLTSVPQMFLRCWTVWQKDIAQLVTHDSFT